MITGKPVTLVPRKPAPLTSHTLRLPGILTLNDCRALDPADTCVQVTGEEKPETLGGASQMRAVFPTPCPSLSSTPTFPTQRHPARGQLGPLQRRPPDVSRCFVKLPTRFGTPGIGAPLTFHRNQWEVSGLSLGGSHMACPLKGHGHWLSHQAT